MRSSLRLSVLIALVFAAPTVLGRDQALPRTANRIAVTVTVDAEDQLLRDQLKSFVTRELRELRDVDVVERAPTRGAMFGLVLEALRTRNGLGMPNGWAVSWVVTQRWYETNDAHTAIRGFNDLYVTSAIFVGSDEDLKTSMQKAVASFDASTLEEFRATFRTP